MSFQFSTVDKTRATDFLKHEEFKELTEAQKEFILNNLGPIRVLDPMMHGGGKFSFENNEIMTEFLKIYVPDPENFMFKYQALYLNPALVAWGLDQGFKSVDYALMTAVGKNHLGLIDLYMERGLFQKSDLIRYLTFEDTLSFETLIHCVDKYDLKKIRFLSKSLEKYSPQEVWTLISKKVITHDSLKGTPMYRAVVELKKKIKKQS